MIKKILIANRGEIAIRIIRTCKKMGIKTVAIYSNEDKDALHVFMADESVCTEKENNIDGYTNMNNIIQAAINTKCDAIHPGYGFLSENYEFAKKVEESGLILIGTKSDTLKEVENKFLLKEKVKKIGVPVIKNYKLEDIKKEDFPVLIKSVVGAGGKGIKKIDKMEDIEEICHQFQHESKRTLNNNEFYIEKFIKGYRHIEIQFAVDIDKNIMTFPERDCSLQKDYKKVIEITPSSRIDSDLVEKMKEDTIKIVKELNYINIGTAEFIVDFNNNYYFLEINPRIQVEHTITEMCTSIDLIKMQIDIADNKSIKEYKNIENNCFAIEVRINALESNKKVAFYNLPLGDDIRLETSIYTGMNISMNYDPLLMKIICKGKTRKDAIKTMKHALEELVIDGVKTNIENVYSVITSKNFINEKYDLDFLNEIEYDCEYNPKIKSSERLEIICDEGSFKELDKDNNDEQNSIIIGTAKINGFDIAIGIMDPSYMAGSIGTYLIDKICNLINYANEKELPLIIFSASGGIRVQEGVKALVGMSKLSKAINDYKEKGLFISFLTNPTYGGLNASLSMLGDIIIAEKDCKIGFSGARVIEKELHQELPQNFQTTEFHYENGLIDIVVSRDKEKEVIARILEQYNNKNKTKQKIEEPLDCDKNKEKISKLELLKSIRNEKHIRPYQIVESICSSLVEIHGDRISKDDKSIKCFFAKMDDIHLSIVYVDRRNDIKENMKTNFGMINPEGYRKVNRFIKLSEKMNSPIVFFIDTPGANAGFEAEKNGQAVAIANLLQEISRIRVPIISFITGEANSGGAIGLITGDYLAMLEHSYLSVISPEAYIDIIYKGKECIENIIEELRILPSEMLEDKIIDEIVDDNDFENLIEKIKIVINNKIVELTNITNDKLIERRMERIEKWGKMNRIAFIFDGQGKEFNDFGKDFYSNELEFKKFIDTYKEIFDIEKNVYQSTKDNINTEIYQPSAFLVEMGIVHLLNKKGIISDNFAGSSLGEYAALCSSGYLKIEDGISILQKRGKLMNKALSKINSEMRAVMFLDNETVEEIVQKYNCEVSNENSYNQVIISGLKENIEKASDECIKKRSKKSYKIRFSRCIS